MITRSKTTRAEPSSSPAASLVAADGTVHSIGEVTIVGRDAAVAQIALADDAVSRRHAELRREPAGFCLRDLESTNGTFVDGARVDHPRLLVGRHLLAFGTVELLFLAPEGWVGPHEREEMPRIVCLAHGARLEHGPAAVELHGPSLRLAMLLAGRWQRDDLLPEPLRGFVRTRELLLELGSAVAPRSLVTTLRRVLAAVNADRALEVNDRLGYRLRATLTP